MARPLRIAFPGALYDVISRGNERQAIVRDGADRRKRLDWLRRTVQVYRDHAGVGQAIRRVEQGTARLHRTVKRLKRTLLST